VGRGLSQTLCWECSHSGTCRVMQIWSICDFWTSVSSGNWPHSCYFSATGVRVIPWQKNSLFIQLICIHLSFYKALPCSEHFPLYNDRSPFSISVWKRSVQSVKLSNTIWVHAACQEFWWVPVTCHLSFYTLLAQHLSSCTWILYLPFDITFIWGKK
jgi:hypothetical protein